LARRAVALFKIARLITKLSLRVADPDSPTIRLEHEREEASNLGRGLLSRSNHLDGGWG